MARRSPDHAPPPTPDAPALDASADEIWAYYEAGGQDTPIEHLEKVGIDIGKSLQELTTAPGELNPAVIGLIAVQLQRETAIRENARDPKVREKLIASYRAGAIDFIAKVAGYEDNETALEATQKVIDRLLLVPTRGGYSDDNHNRHVALEAAADTVGRDQLTAAHLDDPLGGADGNIRDAYRSSLDMYVWSKAHVDAPGGANKSLHKRELAQREDELKAATQEVVDNILMGPAFRDVDRAALALYFLNHASLSIATKEREEMRGLRNRGKTGYSGRLVQKAEAHAARSKFQRIARGMGKGAIAGGIVFATGVTAGGALVAVVPAVRLWRGIDGVSTHLAKQFGSFDAPVMINTQLDLASPDLAETVKGRIDSSFEVARKRTEAAEKSYRKAVAFSLGITALGAGTGALLRMAADMDLGVGFHNPLPHHSPSAAPERPRLSDAGADPTGPADAGAAPKALGSPPGHTELGTIDIQKQLHVMGQKPESAANVVKLNEGWYKQIGDILHSTPELRKLDVEYKDYKHILQIAGPDLEKMKFPDGSPVAYRVGNTWGIGNTTGHFPKEATERIIAATAEHKGLHTSGEGATHLKNLVFESKASIAGGGETLLGQLKDMQGPLSELGVKITDPEVQQTVGKVLESHGYATRGPGGELIMQAHNGSTAIPHDVLAEAVNEVSKQHGIDLFQLEGFIEAHKLESYDKLMRFVAENPVEYKKGDGVMLTLLDIPHLAEAGIDPTDPAVYKAIAAENKDIIGSRYGGESNFYFKSNGRLTTEQLARLFEAFNLRKDYNLAA